MLCKQLQNNATPLFLYSSTEHFCYSLCLRHTFPSCCFFPRAFERRVLPIVGRVCISSSHLHIFASSHPHIFSSSHLLIFTSSHLLIFTSSHLHICSSSHLHILTSSHLLIFTSSHLHISSSSHLLIFTSSHLHILTSPHLLIFTSSHLHICSSSHLLIFTSAHLHIHLLISTSSHLHIFSSCPLALSFFSISLLKARGSANETARNAALPHEMRFDRQKLQKLRFQLVPRNPFARNEVRSPKSEVKLRFTSRPAQPFRTK